MNTSAIDNKKAIERLQQSARPQTTESGSIEDNNQESIAKLAYALWESRGCPVGSSEQDWTEAERQVSISGVQTAAVGR